MSRVSRGEAALLALLLVAAFATYHAMRLPGLVGLINDDGLYALYAKALVTGQGYVSLQWPEHPPAIRYPIGWPAVLAAAMAGAADPAAWAARCQWAAAAAGTLFVGVSYLYLRRHLEPGPALAAAAAVAFGAKTVELGSHVLSDLPFGALSLGALLVLESALPGHASPDVPAPPGHASPDVPGPPGLRGRFPARLACAGLLCGLAFLTRYAAVALIAAAVASLAIRRDFRGLLVFAAACGLIAAPWLAGPAAAGAA
ncbi:MAG: hypothetical protein FJZ01_15370, partial [Candidatus Sericytochromatia bacterium]|nr:hypothetical protein [Candidatus Tanganyikabacteria bacterium]